MTDRLASADLAALADFVAARLIAELRCCEVRYQVAACGRYTVTLPDGMDACSQIVRNRWKRLQAAPAVQTLLDETIRPVLADQGPPGDNAERQLRLLAHRHAAHTDYREHWHP